MRLGLTKVRISVNTKDQQKGKETRVQEGDREKKMRVRKNLRMEVLKESVKFFESGVCGNQEIVTGKNSLDLAKELLSISQEHFQWSKANIKHIIGK